MSRPSRVPQRQRIRSLPGLEQGKNPMTSKAERFTQRPIVRRQPGPADYNPTAQQKHTSDYHIRRTSTEHSDVALEHRWIVGEGRRVFAQFLSTNPVGPGQYQNVVVRRARGHSDWTKNSRFNYAKQEVKEEVGPGYYHKEVATSRFAASGVFKGVSREHSPVKVGKAEQEPVKNFAISALGSQEQQVLEPSTPQGSKNHLSPAFQSRSERFPRSQRSSLGPGSYSLRTEPTEGSASPARKSQQGGLRLGSCHDSMRSVKELEMIREVAANRGQGADITRRAIMSKLGQGVKPSQSKKNVHIEAVYVHSRHHGIEASLRRVEGAAQQVEKRTGPKQGHGETLNVLRHRQRSPKQAQGLIKKGESSLPCLNARLG